MDAMYFYNKLLSYRDEASREKKYYIGYEYSVTIHHRGDTSEWYIIFPEGLFKKCSVSGFSSGLFPVANLYGDDYEIYGSGRVMHCCYMLLDSPNTKRQVCEMLGSLYKYIADLEDVTVIGTPYVFMDALGNSVYTKGFSYSARNGVDVHISTIKEFSKGNVGRKYWGARCLPYIKGIDDESALYVYFVCDSLEQYSNGVDMCKRAKRDLKRYIEKLGINTKWLDCKIKGVIYE